MAFSNSLGRTDAGGAMYGHVLWAEASLSHLPPGFRRMLHRQAAEIFDGEMAVRPTTTTLWESARHWEASGQPAKARAAILCGAEQLEHSGFTAEAAEAYGRALRRSIGANQRLQVMQRRIEALWASGRVADATTEAKTYQTLGCESVPGFDPHNDVELIGLRARGEGMADAESTLHDGFRCVKSLDASRSHRIGAAKMCALAAE